MPRAMVPLAPAAATLLALVLAFALWLACHPYAGIAGDATLYIGRALANLDPDGLGRDIAFADDGQSRFSLFPWLVTPIVAALGAPRAALLVAIAGSTCFFAGLVALARSLATGRVALAMLLVVAVAPVGFGGGHVLGFGETSAIPRPFAEGAVLAAYAALLARREALALAALGLAVLLHPIVAMAGLGIAAWVAVERIGRVRLGLAVASVLAASAVVLALAALAVAPFDRLLVRIDAEWFGIIVTRSPYLFPTRWDQGAVVPIVAQVTTILLVASGDRGRRGLLLALVGSCLAQVAAAALFADTLHGLLVLQAQPWRATWLLAVVGTACLAPCAAMLWAGRAADRVALGLIGLVWFVQPGLGLSLVLCGVSLVLVRGSVGARLSDRHAGWVVGAVVLLLVICAATAIQHYLAFLAALPTGATPTLIDPLRNDLQTIPATLAVAVWLLSSRRLRPDRALLALVVCAIASVATAAWVFDQRTPFRTFVETRADPPGLAALAAGRRRDVLWLDGLAEPWTMLGRPQYFSPQQAPGLLFSRPLAMEWRRRADRLIGLGLVPRGVLTPWSPVAETDRIVATPDRLAVFCRGADAPSLVVMPFETERRLDGVTWTPPAPFFAMVGAGPDAWRVVRGWRAIACGANQPAPEAERGTAPP